MSRWPRRALGALWAAAQWLLAPGYRPLLVRALRTHFDCSRPGRWLDVGCGERSIAAGVLPGWLVGLDCNRAVLRQGAVCGTAGTLPFAAQSFDGVVCFGLLHHLDDSTARQSLAEMRRVARVGAPILVFDAVRPRAPWQRPLAAWLRTIDRGRHVRPEPLLRRLLADRAYTVSPSVTYAWTGLEGGFATAIGCGEKPAETNGPRAPLLNRTD
jgi:SAM-dependent methyltransferase